LKFAPLTLPLFHWGEGGVRRRRILGRKLWKRIARKKIVTAKKVSLAVDFYS
jgi:hypothetical protein